MNRRLCGLEVRSRHFWRLEREKKDLPSGRVTSNTLYAKDYMENLKDEILPHVATYTNALAPKEITCSLRTTELFPST